MALSKIKQTKENIYPNILYKKAETNYTVAILLWNNKLLKEWLDINSIYLPFITYVSQIQDFKCS